MPDFRQPLGDAVKRARLDNNMTQADVAEAIDSAQRTILNIENYKGNPKMHILFALVRELGIDPRDIFYPEHQNGSPAKKKLNTLIDSLSESEAEMLIPSFDSIITVLRSKDAKSIKP